MSDPTDFKALEEELRADELPDPGPERFAQMERSILRAVDERPAPRRPWWRQGLAGWLLQPAPVAALAGAAVVALAVVLSGGPGDGEPEVGLGGPGAGSSKGVATTPSAKAPAPTGKAWLEALPPAEELWAVDDRELPALMAALAGEAPGLGDDPLGVGVDDIAPEASDPLIHGLDEGQLKLLDQLLDEQQSRRPRPGPRVRPRAAMRKAS